MMLEIFKKAIYLVFIFFFSSGVSAMEIVAMDMKLRGMYIARQLSFHGVSFKIEEVPLSDSFKKAYDDSVDLVSYLDTRIQTK